MRIGHNPNRSSRSENLKDVVFGVVTHLPNFTGYHAHRFEVVKTCLRSMVRNSNVEHSLVIWDNGSCEEFRRWVHDEMRPDIFVESINIGKTAGRTCITRMIPPNKVICYSDDDIYYYPDWYKHQYQLLTHFPNVACVTGYPVRTQFRWGNENTKAWGKKYGTLEAGKFIPELWENDFADSIGRDRDFHKGYTKEDLDYKITYNGVEAYATSHHCQFIAKSEVVNRIISFDGMAMGDEKILDETLDTLGLRLATINRCTRHIGNVIHDELRKEIIIQ